MDSLTTSLFLTVLKYGYILCPMDLSPRHFAHLPRKFRLNPVLRNMGYIPEKKEWVRNTFTTFNYSFVLRGGGEYHLGGKTWKVVAPAVITQWPDRHVEYGPTEPWGGWEELFLIFGSNVDFFIDHALVDPKRPVWPIRTFSRIMQIIGDLEHVLRRSDDRGLGDRVDQIAMAMVTESLLGTYTSPKNEKERAIREIRSYVRQHFLEEIDFPQLAAEYGMSHTSFRRYWARFTNSSPAKFLQDLRIREACRLLVETRLSIGEIAQRVGFNDPLYFSRRFRECTGAAATEYRKSHHIEEHE